MLGRRTLLVMSVGLIMLAVAGCTRGNVLITGTKRTPIQPTEVTIYLEPPRGDYEIIGLVSAESEAGWTWDDALNNAVGELKEQAAKIGANGVILGDAGMKSYGAVGMMNMGAYGLGTFMAASADTQAVKGRAIYILK